VLIASDTRLTDGGYGINSRKYLSGRIWSASSSTSQSNFSSNQSTKVGSDASSSKSVSTSILPLKTNPTQWESDGSLVMPSNNWLDFDSETLKIAPKPSDSAMITSPTFSAEHINSRIQTNLPVMIGSAGCASDCESLKRKVRLELDALECSCPTGSLGVQSVANLLQQILYGRRGFPFYSFCVVAGIDQQESYDGVCGSGAVYVYDAIGSYERVAVASAGTGRELLQPILDRLFSGALQSTDAKQIESQDGIRRDAMAVPAGKQRMGAAGSLRPPVQTTVNCPWDEAVDKVARAYKSVAEREISVGDEIVICVVNTSNTRDGGPVVNLFSYPLKKH
ncbi:hypothetical protein ACHAXR_002463, partial [Thalassiosira sp. AJA248-18]